MAEWIPVGDEDARRVWDKELLVFPEANLSQSYAWGEHKRSLGQAPMRFIAREGSRTVAMAQCFIRRYPLGAAVIWVPGGPVGSLALADHVFRKDVMRAACIRSGFFRIRPYRDVTPEAAEGLAKNGWRKAATSLDTGMTIMVPLDRPEPESSKALTANWAHNLRRAQTRNKSIRPWDNPTADQVIGLIKEVEEYKKIPQQYRHSREDIQSLLTHFDGNLILWRCDNASGKPVALRACAVFGNRGYDLLSASSEEGRKQYGAYGLLWELLRESRRRGAREFDMGGIDPAEPGVYNFKRGLGGREVRHLGEWDWASSPLLRVFANFMIAKKVKR